MIEKKVNKAAIVKEAGSAKTNKTGTWRTFIPIITNKCTGCGFCTHFCPDSAIEVVNKKAKIDYEHCKGCLICTEVCPIKAITKEREKK